MKYFLILLGLPLIFFGCSLQKKSVSPNSQVAQAPNDNAGNPEKNGLPKINQENTDTETKIPILMFHYVRVADKSKDPLGYNLSVDPETFGKELAWLKKNGYTTIPIRGIEDGKVPEKSVVLSFDDGYEDFYSAALPLLQKYEFGASVGIITSKINQAGYLSDSQIMDLITNNIEVVSHSESHPDLTKISPDKAQKEIRESKNFLENKLGISIGSFVYPSGEYNGEIEKIVKDSGYLTALTTQPGMADAKGNLLELKRIRIDNRDGFEGFKKKITN
ncbi:MAG: polysaccharide deacetylase family protein [Parcubacteria group bacterium]|jgi:peptidoglycan/xylan/chitin deacetylase (PgdA/CDA1 family)